LNGLPVDQIFAPITSPVLRRIEARAPAMEEKVHRRLNAIMDYAVEVGALRQNPLPRRRAHKSTTKHFPAVVDLPGIGTILRRAAVSDPCRGIQRAHLLLAFTAQRVSEVVGARWDEFDLTEQIWAIPRHRMKKKDPERGPHLVPLPPKLAAQLRQWQANDNATSEFVCPAPRDPAKSVTPEACEKHYRVALNLGGKHSPHSWRSAFKTVCSEAGKAKDVVESQLDHQTGNNVESAYDRAKRLDLRRELMNWYEATLVAARDGAQIVSLQRHA
jgi:integrase